MSKKSKLIESTMGKSLLAAFIGFVVGNKMSKARELKRRVASIDRNTAKTLSGIEDRTRAIMKKYRNAVKNMSPDEKAEFDKTFKFEFKQTLKKVLGN